MNNYKVYCLTNTITNEKYIGVTKQNLSRRFKSGKGYKPSTKINKAIEQYGWGNFTHKILSETNSKKIAGEMEKYYIQEFNTIQNGYNNQTGGFIGYKQIITDETREKQKKVHKGNHYSLKTEFKKGNYYQSSMNKKVPVFCMELNRTFESIKQAQEEFDLHHIWDCINGKRNKCGGYHWKLVGGEE